MPADSDCRAAGVHAGRGRRADVKREISPSAVCRFFKTQVQLQKKPGAGKPYGVPWMANESRR
jgi:hypothetical protein